MRYKWIRFQFPLKNIFLLHTFFLSSLLLSLSLMLALFFSHSQSSFWSRSPRFTAFSRVDIARGWEILNLDSVRVWTAFVVIECARDFFFHPRIPLCCMHSFTCGTVFVSHTQIAWITESRGTQAFSNNIFSTVVHFLSSIRLADCFFRPIKQNPKKNECERCAFLLGKYKNCGFISQTNTEKCEQFSFFIRMKIYDQLLKNQN